jgi:hypothetical protein
MSQYIASKQKKNTPHESPADNGSALASALRGLRAIASGRFRATITTGI